MNVACFLLLSAPHHYRPESWECDSGGEQFCGPLLWSYWLPSSHAELAKWQGPNSSSHQCTHHARYWKDLSTPTDSQYKKIPVCQCQNRFSVFLCVHVHLQVVELYKSWKQKYLMGENTTVWPWTQQERLTNTSISLFLVRSFLHCLYCTVCSQFAFSWCWCTSALAVPPSIRGKSGDSLMVVNVLVGKSVTLECESNAVPPPTITWYKNGRVMTESANLRILAEGQVLEIKGSEVKNEWKPCIV